LGVTVDDGIATLRGRAESWAEREQATEIAFNGGAVLVRNEIEVEHGPKEYSTGPNKPN
jgi:osmotically-inducible protein OsmY